jgi:hypothetical protein
MSSEMSGDTGHSLFKVGERCNDTSSGKEFIVKEVINPHINPPLYLIEWVSPDDNGDKIAFVCIITG